LRLTCGIVGEQTRVVAGQRGDGVGSQLRDGDGAGVRVVRVAAQLLLQTCLQGGASFLVELIEATAVFCLAKAVQDERRLAMHPVRRPVGRDVRAVSPYRADLVA